MSFTIKLLSVTGVKGPFTKQPTQVNRVYMQHKELTLCGNVVRHCACMDGNSPLSMLSRHTHTCVSVRLCVGASK